MYDVKNLMEFRMKKIIISLIVALLFIGCSSDVSGKNPIEPKLVVDKYIDDLVLKDQFEKEHAINKDTYRLIFAFSKDAAHLCNDFFNTQKPTYLQDHHSQFIADVSAAPSLIRSLFILPGLKDFKHTVLLLDDKKVAAPYREGMDTDKVVIVYIINKRIVEIKDINSAMELKEAIEDDSAMSLIAPVFNTAIETTKEILK